MGSTRRRLGAAALSMLLAVLAALAAAPPAGAAGDAPPGPGSGDVAIPYRGSTTIDIAAPWRITDCRVPAQATPLVVGCDERSISLAAPDYDPDAAAVAVPVPLTDGRITTVAEYRVSLEAPETPSAEPARALRPTAAGALLRLPISELGVECAVCGAGGRLRAVAVHPAQAGSLWATPTHLVFRAAQGYTGPAELVYRFADDYGAWSPEGVIQASVLRPGAAPLVTSDLVVELDEGAAELSLEQLGFVLGDDELVLVGCGTAIRGQLRCDADGAIEYRGDGAADQFAVQLATTGGEQALASVTLVPAGDDGADAASASLRPGTAPIAKPKQGKRGVASAIVPRVPVEDHQGAGGLLAPLLAALDRVGAR
ncbi:hypothetical protein [Agromyces sp. NPDC060279]|uniref:hypothetical protein n=1 Tax=Agromyces sp. NPDC060279 TaxID=3347092 RepID=UPI003648860C